MGFAKYGEDNILRNNEHIRSRYYMGQCKPKQPLNQIRFIDSVEDVTRKLLHDNSSFIRKESPVLTVRSNKKSVSLEWKNDSGYSYEIYRAIENRKFRKIATVSASSSGYTDKYVPKGASCCYIIRAVKVQGKEHVYGKFSNQAFAVRKKK